MGPLEMFFSAQSVLCAVIVVMVMKLVTTILTGTMGKESSGRPKYRRNKWVTKLFLPLVTVGLGAAYGWLVPFRPEVLAEFFTEHPEVEGWHTLADMSWGAACGQFSQTLYDRVKGMAQVVRRNGRDDSPDPVKKK